MARLKLVQTCGGCPEQYDVYDNLTGEEIGYLRLRHGGFRVEYKNETILHVNPEGDGSFKDDERDYYLSLACNAILAKHTQLSEELYEVEVKDYESDEQR